MSFPIVRHRRLRQSVGIRNMVRENQLSVDDFIQPIYVTYGENVKSEIKSMPGVFRFSLDRLQEEVTEIAELGIPAVLLFGIPETKDSVGSSGFAEDGIVQEATRLIKSWYPELLVIADTCLCEFTDHGHCGMVHTFEVDGHTCGDVLNDESLELLVKTAVSQAKAGADIIAPSNMMDGFVQAIRAGLDENGFSHIPIMSYSVKYASAFYGPFREAADSTPQFGDRKSYQMDPANAREALREAETDVFEGADMLMVKPSLSYLDVLRTIRDQFDLPLVAYNVSGEYAMVKAAAIQGWIDEKKVAMEILLSMKRAGADMIITYYGKDASRWLAEK
ncbi:delta-aminolevulinic acid dehydratase [Paenibacillus sp. Root52]|uniref:Delta-aminolevulinic acid dehydratase n=2 Tax=Paenibacillus TaxID=44249 RepID=A0AAP5H6M3_PAEAM|nr:MULTISPECIES: porphobilinogen synthase [Paenibacillus]KQY85192.1 delta-aminolevulinic acid dehydratase [Paenibacillus sp. Root52]MCG7380118.1 porphobilinogen synthase [Paenibacillus sp. ACRSA]MDR6727328.1 porphobilinogen synthase [Paenibacillus amylolyticus]